MKKKSRIIQRITPALLERLRCDFAELKRLNLLESVLLSGRFFDNALFDMLPESDFKNQYPRRRLAAAAAVVRECMGDCRALPAEEQSARFKRASERIEAENGWDEGLKYFILELYCRELSDLSFESSQVGRELSRRSRRRRIAEFAEKLAAKCRPKKTEGPRLSLLYRFKRTFISVAIVLLLGLAYLGISAADNYFTALNKTADQLRVLGSSYDVDGGVLTEADYRSQEPLPENETDLVKAVYFYSKAAEKGDLASAKRLLNIYTYGNGPVHADFAKANYYDNLVTKLEKEKSE